MEINSNRERELETGDGESGGESEERKDEEKDDGSHGPPQP